MSDNLQASKQSGTEPEIKVYCTDCDEITRHMIDTFGEDDWWTCEECLQPWMRVRPDDTERLSSVPRHAGPSAWALDYDPFRDSDEGVRLASGPPSDGGVRGFDAS